MKWRTATRGQALIRQISRKTAYQKLGLALTPPVNTGKIDVV
jgi:hypothetical protein